jgi:molybdate transport system substrate-binding protein
VSGFAPRARARRAGARLAGLAVLAAWLSAGAPGRAQGDARGRTEDDSPALRVLAAASLTEVVEALARSFEGARVATSFGSSSELARQIRDGAPADVFVSASAEWIAFLREADALDGDAALIARNALVCIAPKASPLAGNALDPGQLLQRLRPGDGVAIADAGVPAGDYARRALAHAGLLEAFEGRLVGQKDVRAVLYAVERGELAAGFVYATDARLAGVERVFAFDPASHPPIEIHAAALRGAERPAEARRFVARLRGEAARALFAEAGFALP